MVLIALKKHRPNCADYHDAPKPAHQRLSLDNPAEFDVEFIDRRDDSLLYKSKITNNSWCATNIKYFKEYKINLYYQEQLLVSHDFNLKGKNVLIQLDSRSIGDTIAWFPYAEEFRKKVNRKPKSKIQKKSRKANRRK